LLSGYLAAGVSLDPKVEGSNPSRPITNVLANADIGTAAAHAMFVG
jgi:hypothetical protein